MAVPTVVAVGSVATATSGNATPGWPAGLQANDIVVLFLSQKDNVASTASGFTSKAATNRAANHRAEIQWYRANGTESGAFTVTHTGGNSIVARAVAFRGCPSTGDPFDAITASTTTSPTNSLGPTQDDTLCGVFVSHADDPVPGGAAGGGLTWTDRVSSGTTDGTDTAAYVATAPDPGSHAAFTVSFTGGTAGAVAWAFALGPEVGGELTTDQEQPPAQLGIAQQYQRGSFTAAGRRWQFYSTGFGTPSVPKLVFSSTTDNGSTWAPPTTLATLDTNGVAVGSSYFDVHFDGTYVHYARGAIGTTTLYYRRGTPNSNGTITWSAAEQAVTTGSSILECKVATDELGQPWIAYELDTSDVYVVASTTFDGTWSMRSGFPFLVSSEAHHWWTWIGSLGGGKMAAVYYTDEWFSTYTGGAIFARVWDGTSWGSEESVDALALKADSGTTNVAMVSNPATGELIVTFGDSASSSTWAMVRDSAGSYTQEFVTGDVSGLVLGLDSGNGTAHLVCKDPFSATTLQHYSRAGFGFWNQELNIVTDETAGEIYPGGFQISEQPYGGEFLVSVQYANSSGDDPIVMYSFAGSGSGNHVTAAWRSSYRTQAHETRTWPSSYAVKEHLAATWQSRYVVREHTATSWQSAYGVKDRRLTTWSSTYVVRLHEAAGWQSSYVVQVTGTTHETRSWPSSYVTRTREASSWASGYVVRDRRASNWASSYRTSSHETTAWSSGYVVNELGSSHETRVWRSSYTTRAPAATAWASSYAVLTGSGASWQSSYTVRARAGTSWPSRYVVHARPATNWASSYRVSSHLGPVRLAAVTAGSVRVPAVGRASSARVGQARAARAGAARRTGVNV